MDAQTTASLPPDPLDHSRMSLGDHLAELRSRLLKALYGILITFVICLFLAGDILGLLAQPLLLALHAAGQPPQLYTAAVPEAFLTYVRISFYAAIFLSSPWTFYQLWSFISAGLYPREQRAVRFFVPFSAALFILGGLFFIIVVAPLSCTFFINFAANIESPQLTDSFISRALIRFVDADTAAPDDAPDDVPHDAPAQPSDPTTITPPAATPTR